MGGKIGEQETANPDFVQVFYLEKEMSELEQNIIEAKKELEDLHGKLACAKREKATLLADTETLKKQKGSLEEECADLSVKSEGKSKELQDKNTQLENAKKQLDSAVHDRKRFLRKWKIALGILAAVIFAGYTYFEGEVSELELMNQEAGIREKEAQKKISGLEDLNREAQAREEEAQKKISGLEDLNREVQAREEEAQKKISELGDLYQEAKAGEEKTLEKLLDVKKHAGPVMIEVEDIYNGNGSWKMGDDLKASRMHFLYCDFNAYFLEDDVEGATIYVDVYNPDGNLYSVTDRAGGHTSAVEFEDADDRSGSLKWGDFWENTYFPGTYCIEFIYDGEIVHSQKVILSD